MTTDSIADRIRSEIDFDYIHAAANKSAVTIGIKGLAAVNLQPGNRTQYGIIVINQQKIGTHIDPGGKYLFTSRMGPARALPSYFGDIHDGYVRDNYLSPAWQDPGTVMVVTEYLQRLGTAIHALEMNAFEKSVATEPDPT